MMPVYNKNVTTLNYGINTQYLFWAHLLHRHVHKRFYIPTIITATAPGTLYLIRASGAVSISAKEKYHVKLTGTRGQEDC